MKKLLLLLAGLLWYIIPTKAQTTTYPMTDEVINESENLKAGTYIIHCETSDGKSGYLYYKTDDNSRPFRFNESSPTHNTYYVWTVSEVTREDGKKLYTIANVGDPTKSLLKDPQWNKNMSIDNSKSVAELEAETYTDASGEKTIALKLPERINPADGYANADPYIFCNTAGDPNLSYWGGNASGAVHFRFYPVTAVTSSYPFVLSDAPTDGKFADNTYWYYMTISENGQYTTKGYVTYDATAEKGTGYSLPKTNPISYGSFWAFVKTANGEIEIYNAATGPNYVLASTSPTGDGGNTYPEMTLKNDLDESLKGTWNILYTDGDEYFYLGRPGEENSYLNSRSSKLAFWVNQKSKTDAGSRFRVQEVNINEVISDVRTKQVAIKGAVGTLTPEYYPEFLSNLDKNTAEGLANALKIRDLMTASTTVQFSSDKYYRLMTPGRAANNYMTVNATTAVGQNLSASNASQIWKFTGDEENGYKLSAQGHYMNTPAKSTSVGNTTEADNSASFTISKAGQAGLYYLDGNGSDQYDKIHLDGSSNIVGWEESDASKWYLIEATSIDVTISDAEYATVNYPFAVKLPKGVTAYTGVPDAENSKFILAEVPNGAVPANTPVVISGPKETYTLTIDYENTAEPIKSGLTGVLLPTEITTNDYILANGGNGIGFYTTTKGGTLGQNKAYIKATPATLGVRGFGFTTKDDGDTTTGIESTIAESENEEYYDLQGRRVMNPTKGIYVTKSGKKVLFTK